MRKNRNEVEPGNTEAPVSEPIPAPMDRRRFSLLGLLGLAAAASATAGVAVAAPNGTRPTMLEKLSVVAVNSKTMRVSGRYVQINGMPISGMKIVVYSVGITYFTQWWITYTDSKGNFNATMSKVPVGTQVQIEAEGNGAYSRPFPTFPRP